MTDTFFINIIYNNIRPLQALKNHNTLYIITVHSQKDTHALIYVNRL